MTLETVYYITQIIAVGAILASLVAIYIQQRKDHALARAEHQRQILAEARRYTELAATDPAALESIRKCYQDFEGASPQDQAVFFHLMHTGVNIAEMAFYMRKDKLINDASYAGFEGAALLNLATPGGRQYWQRARLVVGTDIREALDKALSERTDTPPVWEFLPQFAPVPEAPTSKGEPQEEPGE